MNLSCKHWKGRLMLIKSVLEAVLVYCLLLTQIPKGTLIYIWYLCFNYLWKGKTENRGVHLVSWKCISKPKEFSGWGLKDGVKFGLGLVTKSMWALLTKQSLWKNALQAKYLAPLTILDWIWAKNKHYPTASTQWCSLTKVFPLIGNFLTWKWKRSQHQDRLRCNNWVWSQHISQSGTHSDTHFKAQDTSHLESASKMGVDHIIETRLALSSRFKLRGTLESGLAKLHRLSDSSTYPPLRRTRRARLVLCNSRRSVYSKARI